MTVQEFIENLLKEDELGVVLRTHLYIEYFVDKIVEELVPYPNHLKSINLDFHGKTNLIVALGIDPEVKKPLMVFNSIRNRFAHKPNYKLTKSDVNNLYQELSKEYKDRLQRICKDVLKDIDEPGRSLKFGDLSERDAFIALAIAVRDIVFSELEKLGTSNEIT